jgi:uncharacterized protein YjfI (DUF2170 family)
MSVLNKVVEAVQNGSVEGLNLSAEIQDDVVIITEANGLCLPVMILEVEDTLLAQSSIAPLSLIPEEERPVFYEAILQSNPSTNLTDVGLVDGNVVAYGSLSSDSKVEVIFQEIETLIYNASEFAASINQEFLS